jgi:DNA-binding Lrp family transcriptional regulator
MLKEKILLKIGNHSEINIYELAKILNCSYSTIHDNIENLEKENFIKKIYTNNTIKEAKLLLTEKGLVYALSLLTKKDLEIFYKIIENYKNVYFSDLLNIFEKRSIEALLFLKSSAKISIPFLKDLKEGEEKIIPLIFYHNCFITFLLFSSKSKIYKTLRNEKKFLNMIKYVLDNFENMLNYYYSILSLLEDFYSRKLDYDHFYNLGFKKEEEIQNHFINILKEMIKIFQNYKPIFLSEKEIIFDKKK